ncbi:HDOD domain-containing protein [Solimonas sp. K1W22B-7]|uniref:HDOD domain-containing protein n=1 Tax=Solimonas sp. K1W22B-7 TaxID=2303331 RepID=UPI0013C509FC|nr:HDOD domain-containing protein [Solimonas sp. K1W22B-7]
MAVADAQSLLDHINNLPTVPKAIRDLMVEFDKPEADVGRVSRLIGADPVLSAKLLRMANSAFYHRKGTVNRLQDAVVFVGTHATRNLVMSVGLSGAIRFPAQFPAQSFWRYSLHSAVAARHLAHALHADAETAFAVGLMRALGEPLAASVMGTEMSALDQVCPFYDEARTGAERSRLGFTYVDVTAALAERWHFPQPMVAALRESQGAPEGPDRNLGQLVALGAWMAGEFEWRRSPPSQLPAVVTARLRSLGLEDSALHDMPSLPHMSEGLEALVH